MANNLIEELLKKLGLGGGSQIDPTALPAGSKRPIEQVMTGDAQAKPTHRKTILNAFMPEQTEDESSARRRALLQMGAQMMASSGPSYEPKNLFSIAGQGLAAGIQGYDSSLENAQKSLLTGAKVAANDAALAKQKRNADFAAKFGPGAPINGQSATGGLEGLSQEKLMLLHQHLLDNEKFSEANVVLNHIMKLRNAAADKGMIVGEDGKFVSAPGYTEGLNENSRAEDAGKYTADRKNYDLYVEQTKQEGKEPLSFNDWGLEQKKAGSSKVNVNTGVNSDKFVEEIDKEAAKNFGEIIKEGQNAPQMVANIRTLHELGQKIQTGKMAEFKMMVGPWVEALGVDVEGLDEIQAYRALVYKMTPEQRPDGSGAASDADMRMFMLSLPNIANTPEGNELIEHTITALQQYKIAKAELANRAASGEIKWTEANRLMAELPDPFERFKMLKDAKAKEGIDITNDIREAQNAPSTVDETALPKVTTQEEQDALPAGTLYIAPDGSKRRKK